MTRLRIKKMSSEKPYASVSGREWDAGIVKKYNSDFPYNKNNRYESFMTKARRIVGFAISAVKTALTGVGADKPQINCYNDLPKRWK